jgi:hypothetical protein
MQEKAKEGAGPCFLTSVSSNNMSFLEFYRAKGTE